MNTKFTDLLAEAKSCIQARIKFYLKIFAAFVGISVLIFVIYPFVKNSVADFLQKREYRRQAEELKTTRRNHETNANTLAAEAERKYEDWQETQAERIAAETQVRRSQENLKNQEKNYENAQNGNLGVRPDLPLDERKRNALRADCKLYPARCQQ